MNIVIVYKKCAAILKNCVRQEFSLSPKRPASDNLPTKQGLIKSYRASAVKASLSKPFDVDVVAALGGNGRYLLIAHPCYTICENVSKDTFVIQCIKNKTETKLSVWSSWNQMPCGGVCLSSLNYTKNKQISKTQLSKIINNGLQYSFSEC